MTDTTNQIAVLRELRSKYEEQDPTHGEYDSLTRAIILLEHEARREQRRANLLPTHRGRIDYMRQHLAVVTEAFNQSAPDSEEREVILEDMQTVFDICRYLEPVTSELASVVENARQLMTHESGEPGVRRVPDPTLKALIEAADLLSRPIEPEEITTVLALTGTRLPVILHCPQCKQVHVDVATEEWDNPPHRSHKCQTPGCGCIWRPADFPTDGVHPDQIMTVGKTDNYDFANPSIALFNQQVSDDRLTEITHIARRDDWHRTLVGSDIRLLASDLFNARLMLASLSDPAAVHINMLRGGIARPSPANIWHIYRSDLLYAMPSDLAPPGQANAIEWVNRIDGLIDMIISTYHTTRIAGTPAAAHIRSRLGDRLVTAINGCSNHPSQRDIPPALGGAESVVSNPVEFADHLRRLKDGPILSDGQTVAVNVHDLDLMIGVLEASYAQVPLILTPSDLDLTNLKPGTIIAHRRCFTAEEMKGDSDVRTSLASLLYGFATLEAEGRCGQLAVVEETIDAIIDAVMEPTELVRSA